MMAGASVLVGLLAIALASPVAAVIVGVGMVALWWRS
jgi:hypothetical protein